jgi:hypothetical protein
MAGAAIRCQKCGSIYPSTDQRCPTCEANGELGSYTTETHVGRIAIREMVEDAFRSQMLFQQNYINAHPHSTRQESQDAGNEFFQRWAQRIDAIADLMPPEQGAAFRDMVGEEYGFLTQELERNPQALGQRLGVAMGRSAPQVVYRRQGIGEMAVRTAVRATIWELIWSLFRR